MAWGPWYQPPPFTALVGAHREYRLDFWYARNGGLYPDLGGPTAQPTIMDRSVARAAMQHAADNLPDVAQGNVRNETDDTIRSVSFGWAYDEYIQYQPGSDAGSGYYDQALATIEQIWWSYDARDQISYYTESNIYQDTDQVQYESQNASHLGWGDLDAQGNAVDELVQISARADLGQFGFSPTPDVPTNDARIVLLGAEDSVEYGDHISQFNAYPLVPYDMGTPLLWDSGSATPQTLNSSTADFASPECAVFAAIPKPWVFTPTAPAAQTDAAVRWHTAIFAYPLTPTVHTRFLPPRRRDYVAVTMGAPPPLRLKQRDDQVGLDGNARLPLRNHSTSQQGASSPRVAGRNQYL